MLCFCSCVLCALTGTTWTTAWGPMCLWGSKLRPSPVPAYTSLPGLCRWEETVFQPKVFVFFFCPLSLAVCSANASVETFDAIFPQIPLPTKPHWYLLFGVTEDEIKEVCITTLKLYTRKKVLFLKSRKSPRPVRFNIVKRESLTPIVHSTLLWTVMTVV